MAELGDRGKILIADDAPINMQVIQNQLEELKQTERCIFCYDGEDAI